MRRWGLVAAIIGGKLHVDDARLTGEGQGGPVARRATLFTGRSFSNTADDVPRRVGRGLALEAVGVAAASGTIMGALGALA